MQKSTPTNTLAKQPVRPMYDPPPPIYPPHTPYIHKAPYKTPRPKLLPNCCFLCRAEQPEAVKEMLVAPLLAGLASHHVGCLPAWKALVERCFQQGLLKVPALTHLSTHL